MTYRAKPITQRDGSAFANSNCLMAAAAVGLDFHTLGEKTSNGAKMRDHSGDTIDGTNTDEIVRAWATGYDEQARNRDGRTFDDAMGELWDGRLVMLQVWHATMGGPCLSGSGGYGHGISVAPEQRLDADGSRQWLVADPWCKPPSWVWWDQSRLKAGAEEWAGRVAREAGGQDVRDIARELVLAAMLRLNTRWNPGHPALDDEAGPGVGGAGGGGILYGSTAAHPEATDMPIQAPSSLGSDYTLTLPEGTPYYGDSDLRDKYSELQHEYTLPYVGVVVGGKARAVVLETSGPYAGDEKKPTVVYVPEDAAEPVRHDPEPSDIAARDREWRAWLDGDSGAPDR